MKRQPLFYLTRPVARPRWVLWLAAALLAVAVIPAHAQSTGDPLVLAFYYPWYDESTWTYDKISDLPAEPYVSRDRGVMGRQIDQAKAAGIDALLVAWYGPGGGPNQTETNLAAMLDEAGARGFKIGVLFETTSPFFGGTGDVTAALQHLLNVHANHPAFLRADGRPVVFFWRPTLYGVDTWRAIRSQADPNYSSLWISEGVDTSYLAVFDGHHLYSNTWNPPADLTATNAKFAARVEQARQSTGAYKLWVATVMPGYNDVRVHGGFARDREGGAYFAQSWQAAIASRPNWIVINSFNEWPEGSYIEPSAAFGDQFIGLSAAYSAQFKSAPGGLPAIAVTAALAAPPPTPTPTPPPSIPTAFVSVGLVNLRAGPGVDFDLAGQVAAGAALPIRGRHHAYPDWWQVDAAAGPVWVYAPLVTAAGPLDQVAALGDGDLPTLAAANVTLAIDVAAPGDVPSLEDDPAASAPPLLAPLLDPGFDSLRPSLAR